MLVCTTSFSFATVIPNDISDEIFIEISNDISDEISNEVFDEMSDDEMPNQATEDHEWECVPFTLSCGITGFACGETTSEIIAKVLWAEQQFCS
ncbi:hypothetical protein [Aureibaculum conchae]|uniref:hypothetical protein n=1 Tax=Aureibaculum sp. 2308TA14-22 TaxID=3108392 RepID=UPI00339A7FFA